jgi:hypothetical protein
MRVAQWTPSGHCSVQIEWRLCGKDLAVLTGVLVGRRSAWQVIVSMSVESSISGQSSTPVYKPADMPAVVPTIAASSASASFQIRASS